MDDFNFTLLSFDLGDSLKPFVESASDSLIPVFKGFKGVFYYIFDKPIKYGIVKEEEIRMLSEVTRNKTELIPNDNLNYNNLNKIGKILDDSIFQLSINDFREMYSSLIVACIDDSKNVKPFYSSIIKEMSADEANLLRYFFKYKFLYEMNISSDNPYFVKENTYKYFWKPKYYKLNSAKPHDLLRDFDSNYWENAHDNSEFFESNVSESFKFLISKKIIEEDFSSQWDEFVPSIKKFALETDDHVIQLKQENKELTSPVKFECNHTVYKLSDLGESFKLILTSYDYEVPD